MKKKLVILLMMAMVMSICGCSKDEDSAPAVAQAEEQVSEEADEAAIEEEPEEAEEVYEEEFEGEYEEFFDYPSNNFESRVGQYYFDSYDEIVGMLEGKEAYAYVDIMGGDEKVLLVADDAYNMGDGKTIGATTVTPYIKNADGKYMAGSVMYSDDRRYPLAINEEGIVYVCRCNQLSVEGMVLGENGTPVKGIMNLFQINKSTNEDGCYYYFGFSRDENTVVNNDGVQMNSEDSTFYDEKLKEYDAAEIINFTYADGTEPTVCDPAEIAGSYVCYGVEEYEDDAMTVDYRIIINPDGTGVESAQDIIPIKEITGTKIVFDGEYEKGYLLIDDVLVLNSEMGTETFVKSGEDVSDDIDELNKVRESYCHPEEKDTEVVAGTYRETYAELFGGWIVNYSELVVAEDGSATTMFQDVGPVLSLVENGRAVGEDGTEYPCVVSRDCISIEFDPEFGGYTTFVRVE